MTQRKTVKKVESTEAKPEVAKTQSELELSARLNQGSNDWKTITEDDLHDYSLAEDPYKLPPEAQKLQNERKYAFRWGMAKTERVDELQSLEPPARWWVVNRNQPGEGLDKLCDLSGGIRKHDQLLFFKPWWMHVKHQELKQGIARAKDEAGDIASRHGQKEEYGEWKSGEEYKITSSDEVLAEAGE